MIKEELYLCMRSESDGRKYSVMKEQIKNKIELERLGRRYINVRSFTIV